jgi:hypothetical protein
MQESWTDGQVAIVYGIQGTLRATADLLGLSRETVRKSLKRSGIETSNADGRGAKFRNLEPPARTCEQCGLPRKNSRSRHCGVCAVRESGKTRRRISDARLVDAIRSTRDIKTVAETFAMSSLGVRARLGTIYFYQLIGVADDG